jgi:protocatechuate 3,4-dioxygenase, alpha subunit
MTLPLTPSSTVGPFFSVALLDVLGPELVESASPGAIRIEGVVRDGAGDAVRDAMLEIWQADPEGRYSPGSGFGRCGTDADGRFHFVTVKPGRVPGPDGRPQAPHLALGVFARGLLKRLATRIYFPDEAEANAVDPVLSELDDAARATLVARQEEGVLRFDVRLQGEGETTFLAV